MLRFFLISNLLILTAYSETIDTIENQEIHKAINQVSYEPNWFSMIIGLFTVVFLIYLTGYLYQKLIRIKLSNKNIEQNKIDVLSTTSIGQGRNLHVIKIGEKNILIGATQNNITYITDVDKINKGSENDNKNC